ncbi:MAG: hypothetical protein ABJG42_24595 [Vibrio splendidus]
MSDNLKIWSTNQKTDPSHVKDAQKGLSSIDAYYIFQQATKMFGPCGIGWGYEELREDYQSGEPIIDKSGEITGTIINHVIRIKLWYKWNGEKGEINSIGSTKYLSKNKYGMVSDEEAAKKSLTDAIKKALSMLGFSADVYMGMFEDANYRTEVGNEKAIEKAVDKDAEKARQAEALKADFDKCIIQMQGAVSMSMLEGLYKSMARRLTQRDTAMARQLTKVKDEMIVKLSEGEE